MKAFEGFERQAMLRLERLHAADRLVALKARRETDLKDFMATGKANTASESMINGGLWPEGSPGPLNVEITDYH